MAPAQARVRKHGVPPLMASVAFAPLLLLRDSIGEPGQWGDLLVFIDTLLKSCARSPRPLRHLKPTASRR